MASWKNREDYPPENCDVAILGWEFARRDPRIQSGELIFVNQPALDPQKSYWKQTSTGTAFEARLLMFSNSLSPAHVTDGKSLGAAAQGHMHVSIDLTEPLSETLRKVEILANFERERLRKKGVEIHEHSKLTPKNLVQYLRVLDAKKDGAPDRETEEILDLGSRALEDAYKKAKQIRDGAWRDIARMKSKPVRKNRK